MWIIQVKKYLIKIINIIVINIQNKFDYSHRNYVHIFFYKLGNPVEKTFIISGVFSTGAMGAMQGRRKV